MASFTKVNGSFTSSTGPASWGNITGDINNQSDLVSLLDKNEKNCVARVTKEIEDRSLGDARLTSALSKEEKDRKLQDEYLYNQIAWATIKGPFYESEDNDELKNEDLEYHFNKYNKDIDLVIGTFKNNPEYDYNPNWYKYQDSEGNWKDYNKDTGQGPTEYGQCLCIEYWDKVEVED